MNPNHIYIKDLDTKIIKFIKKHHVLTLATSNDNIPYCCSCFYVYNEKENYFLVTSDKNTRHISEVVIQPHVSGAIALETTMIGKIQGIQFTGTMKEVKQEEFNIEKIKYIKRFPIAAFAELLLWRIVPDFIKFTDNRLGLGKKMIWQKKF
ncbi:MAG TPA: hypothetical protein PKK00_00645 [Bacteroidales bacterium]|nr:hypothetical protein [Bacteroidales bacterium]HPS15984.1 hypothetical protein [Bacteroidales bacterium]